MCLAIPGEILSVDDGGELRAGRVSFGGIVKEVCLACVPEARVGDFVLVHAGFAITVVSAEHAADVLATLEGAAPGGSPPPGPGARGEGA